MSFTSNVPSIQFTATGLVLPLEADILNGAFADIQTAIGGNESTSLSSPQGQWAQSLTAIIGDKNDQIAYICNQVDPNNASGRMQDAVGYIYFMTRIAGSGTLVNVVCSGVPGYSIPAGAILQDSVTKYNYASTTGGTFNSSGQVTIPFQCLTQGPIACGAGDLTIIYQQIVGWESATNPSAGAEGTLVESRADFEFRRQNSVAINAVNSAQSILANVLNVPNVIDAYVIDNPTNATVNTGATNYPVAANSVYIAVAGGTAAQIAQAIYQKKSLGCSYNGNQTYSLTDTTNVLGPPYPTYTIQWENPTSVPIYIAVDLVNNTSLPSNIVALVQAAVLNAFVGGDGGTRARIGGQLLASRYYAGIAGIATGVEIISVFIGQSASPTGSSTTLGIDQLPTLQASNITVTLT